jgi:hypothetical protein
MFRFGLGRSSVLRVTEWSRLNVHQRLWLFTKVKVKVKVTSKHDVTDIEGGVGVKLYLRLASVLHRCALSTLHLDRFNPGKELLVLVFRQDVP